MSNTTNKLYGAYVYLLNAFGECYAGIIKLCNYVKKKETVENIETFAELVVEKAVETIAVKATVAVILVAL
jgi:hypothetical protein